MEKIIDATFAQEELHLDATEELPDEILEDQTDHTDSAILIVSEEEDANEAEQDTTIEGDGAEAPTEEEEDTKKERTRKVSDKQKEKFAKEKAEDYDEDYDGEPVIDSSDLCERFTITKSVAKDVYLMLAQMLFEKTGQFFKWNDDEPAPNSDNPYINHKGTIVISKAALDSMPSFTTWKEGKTKFVVAEKDGIITMTPIQ